MTAFQVHFVPPSLRSPQRRSLIIQFVKRHAGATSHKENRVFLTKRVSENQVKSFATSFQYRTMFRAQVFFVISTAMEISDLEESAHETE